MMEGGDSSICSLSVCDIRPVCAHEVSIPSANSDSSYATGMTWLLSHP